MSSVQRQQRSWRSGNKSMWAACDRSSPAVGAYPANGWRGPRKRWLIGIFSSWPGSVSTRQEKKRFGAIAYIKQAVQIGWNYRGSSIALKIDGKKLRGRFLMAVVGNSQLYGGVMKFTVNALINDGLLDICAIQGRSMIKAPLRLFSIFSQTHHRDDRIKYHQARQIQFLSRKPIPVQVDGDYLGTTPMLFEVVPKGLWALIPPNADKGLWQGGELPSRFNPAQIPATIPEAVD
jgi:hypothetical protein